MSSLWRFALAVLLASLAGGVAASGQARRGAPAPARAPAQGTTRTEMPQFRCPNELGYGITTKRTFCDVTIGSEAASGIIIPLPPHTGPVTLTFDLHNRHTYSEELSKTIRGFRRYTATIGVMTADNTLLTRAVVQNEVRTAKDLFDRISGGAGIGGVKAVAPTGSESIVLSIAAAEMSVSILGEKLTEERLDATGLLIGDTFVAAGRPIAVISNVLIQYRPGPPPRTPARRR